MNKAEKGFVNTGAQPFNRKAGIGSGSAVKLGSKDFDTQCTFTSLKLIMFKVEHWPCEILEHMILQNHESLKNPTMNGKV